MREGSRNISFLSYGGASKVDIRNSSVVQTGRLRQAIQNRKKKLNNLKRKSLLQPLISGCFNETEAGRRNEDILNNKLKNTICTTSKKQVEL